MSMSEYTDAVGMSDKGATVNYMLYDMDVEVVEMKVTGVWKIGNNDHIELKFYDGQKPKWFHRLMARVFLGWTWVDLK